jgi:hypothetical protein
MSAEYGSRPLTSFSGCADWSPLQKVTAIVTMLLCGCSVTEPPAEPSAEPIDDTASTCVAVSPGELDRWGGASAVDLGATGFFRVEKVCDRWWFVTPEGHPFYSAGVNSARPGGDFSVTGRAPYREAVSELYVNDEAWGASVVSRMREWNVNTVGSWSTVSVLSGVAVTVNLALASDDWIQGTVTDYFSDEWADFVGETTLSAAAEWAGRPELLGWFIDNENRWGPDWRGSETLLQLYLILPPESGGKAAAVDMLVEHFGGTTQAGDFIGLAQADRNDLLEFTGSLRALDAGASETQALVTELFITLAAERYFEVTTGAIRAADPNHLVLGNREIATLVPPGVLDAAALHVDVLSINHYTLRDGIGDLARVMSGALDPANNFEALHERHDLPILVSEFGFRAADSGPPCTRPLIYPVLATQVDRADAWESTVVSLQGTPWIVGHHWYKWVDNPIEGRRDGEDNNWGLVDVYDAPYPELTERMTSVNPRIWEYLRVP